MLDDIFKVPVNILLVVWTLLVALDVAKSLRLRRQQERIRTQPPLIRPDAVLFRDYSTDELQKYSGRDGGSIYIAVDGAVFDVTAYVRFVAG
jgi:hypothetical protein